MTDIAQRMICHYHSYPCQDTDNDHVSPLLSFNPSSVPSFIWGILDGPHSPRSFYHATVCEIVHWCRTIFKVPSGKFDNLFVHELSHLFQAYADTSSMESMAGVDLGGGMWGCNAPKTLYLPEIGVGGLTPVDFLFC